jgi:hypothetical protein
MARPSDRWGIASVPCSPGSAKRRLLTHVLRRVEGYRRERDAYLRLREHGVLKVLGHWVPQLLGHDDRLGVIELWIVAPPYVLDFAKVRFDEPLEEVFHAEVLEERWAYWQSLFEPDQWPQVLAIFRYLGGQYGIWLEDLSPGNIRFADEAGDPDQP